MNPQHCDGRIGNVPGQPDSTDVRALANHPGRTLELIGMPRLRDFARCHVLGRCVLPQVARAPDATQSGNLQAGCRVSPCVPQCHSGCRTDVVYDIFVILAAALPGIGGRPWDCGHGVTNSCAVRRDAGGISEVMPGCQTSRNRGSAGDGFGCPRGRRCGGSTDYRPPRLAS